MSESAAPVVIADGFFSDAVAQQLLAFALAQEAGFRPSKVALLHEGIVDASRRVSKVNTDMAEVMPLVEAAIRQAVDDAMPRLGLVNVDSYLLEPELAWSGDGAFFKMHTDSLRYRTSHRVMTMVYYFHQQPKAFSGGQLRVYGIGAQAGSGNYQEIEPQWNRAVFFPSWFPHEVLPVQCSTSAFADGRFAMSCWVHKTYGSTP